MLTFTNERTPASVDELDAIGRDQLRICGQRWDGEDLPAAERLFPSAVEIETNFHTKMLAVWAVLDGDAHVYDAWFYAVDSGLVFLRASTDVVCAVVQFDFQPENPRDAELARSLAGAARRAGAI
jgi:hypothetical protein